MSTNGSLGSLLHQRYDYRGTRDVETMSSASSSDDDSADYTQPPSRATSVCSHKVIWSPAVRSSVLPSRAPSLARTPYNSPGSRLPSVERISLSSASSTVDETEDNDFPAAKRAQFISYDHGSDLKDDEPYTGVPVLISHHSLPPLPPLTPATWPSPTPRRRRPRSANQTLEEWEKHARRTLDDHMNANLVVNPLDRKLLWMVISAFILERNPMFAQTRGVPRNLGMLRDYSVIASPYMASMTFNVKEIATKPFDGQKPGTSGLRKRVKVFQQEHYTENFVQAIFDSIKADGATLVIGGDGRYFSPETVQTILKIGSANGVAKFIVGKDSILSTPAASNIIRKYKADGGILLTASHNPGGPDNDFGIKYNVSNGGPAPESVTNQIYEKTKTIQKYKVIEAPAVSLSDIGDFTYGPTKVTIIDSVADYLVLLKDIFDFPLIKSFLDAHRSDYRVLFDGLHGVTGPYAKEILVGALGLPDSSVQNCVPLPDFGGGHPDPNLTYAHTLVDAVEKNGIEFGAASDGDGDRNMIYGKGAFVTPSDSVAIIANWAHVIPYFQKNGGVKGLARSMPTSKAIDLVAKKKGLEYFEVPTGWKFFGNLMDAGRLSICGEESFGTGSDHIREKDGLWAVIAWLNIIAAANRDSPNKLIGINDVLQAHYEEYGRSFFSRYDYEEVPSEGANALVAHINEALKSGSLTNTTHKSQSSTEFTVSGLYDFEYTDPIDKSVSSNQGQVITFSDGSRVVFRLSGTGSQGATVRMYVERYLPASAGAAELGRDAADGLKDLIEVALEISKLKEFLGRDKPTVIT
ncbi:hypothetical protein C0991_005189 [Blastosporella zonata]|nr:hypothetical protein C0991_005189 [Blastosporella zonata]